MYALIAPASSSPGGDPARTAAAFLPSWIPAYHFLTLDVPTKAGQLQSGRHFCRRDGRYSLESTDDRGVDGDRRNEFSVLRSMFRIQIEGRVLMANIVRESNPFVFQDRKK